jgi:putative oxidoreductase
MFANLFRFNAANQDKDNVVALILRAGLAVIFLYHGLDKITTENAGSTWIHQMYQSRPEILIPETLTFSGIQFAVAWGEFLGGLALAVGLLTRLAAVGLILIQLGAIYLVTAPRGFSFERGGGYEYNIALVAMCLALLVLGAGVWSVDWVLLRNRELAHRHAAVPAPHLAGTTQAPGPEVEPVVTAQPRSM